MKKNLLLDFSELDLIINALGAFKIDVYNSSDKFDLYFDVCSLIDKLELIRDHEA